MAKLELEPREKALAAYEASDLKRQDREKNETATNCIMHVLKSFGVDAQVNSDIYRLGFFLFPGNNLI